MEGIVSQDGEEASLEEVNLEDGEVTKGLEVSEIKVDKAVKIMGITIWIRISQFLNHHNSQILMG